MRRFSKSKKQGVSGFCLKFRVLGHEQKPEQIVVLHNLNANLAKQLGLAQH